MKKVLFILLFSSLLFPCLAQLDSLTHIQDSINKAKAAKKKTYSGPRRASIMSAVLPGLGQVYNKKYWKVPVIYAGLGGFGYLFSKNNERYNFYRKNLIAENDDDPATKNTTRYSTEDLKSLKTGYKKNRDLAAFGVIVFYLLNIVDANVDAHLKTFDVSDDLSLQIRPWQTIYSNGIGYGAAAGVSLKLRFK